MVVLGSAFCGRKLGLPTVDPELGECDLSWTNCEQNT